MRRKSASRFSGATLEIPSISKTIPRVLHPENVKKPLVQSRPVPPSEEMIKRLNMIGREYPFCVLYKYGANDLL